jgi:hypothetical protein
MPNEYKDGNNHTATAYALNDGSGGNINNPVLASPRTFNCTLPIPAVPSSVSVSCNSPDLGFINFSHVSGATSYFVVSNNRDTAWTGCRTRGTNDTGDWCIYDTVSPTTRYMDPDSYGYTGSVAACNAAGACSGYGRSGVVSCTPPPVAPTCILNGPDGLGTATVVTGVPNTFAVTCFGGPGVEKTLFYDSPTSAAVWDVKCDANGSSCSADVTWNTPGEHYLSVTAHSVGSNANGGRCSANPWCEWDPVASPESTCAPAYSDCGDDDLIVVTVESDLEITTAQPYVHGDGIPVNWEFTAGGQAVTQAYSGSTQVAPWGDFIAILPVGGGGATGYTGFLDYARLSSPANTNPTTAGSILLSTPSPTLPFGSMVTPGDYELRTFRRNTDTKEWFVIHEPVPITIVLPQVNLTVTPSTKPELTDSGFDVEWTYATGAPSDHADKLTTGYSGDFVGLYWAGYGVPAQVSNWSDFNRTLTTTGAATLGDYTQDNSSPSIFQAGPSQRPRVVGGWSDGQWEVRVYRDTDSTETVANPWTLLASQPVTLTRPTIDLSGVAPIHAQGAPIEVPWDLEGDARALPPSATGPWAGDFISIRDATESDTWNDSYETWSRLGSVDNGSAVLDGVVTYTGDTGASLFGSTVPSGDYKLEVWRDVDHTYNTSGTPKNAWVRLGSSTPITITSDLVTITAPPVVLEGDGVVADWDFLSGQANPYMPNPQTITGDFVVARLTTDLGTSNEWLDYAYLSSPENPNGLDQGQSALSRRYAPAKFGEGLAVGYYTFYVMRDTETSSAFSWDRISNLLPIVVTDQDLTVSAITPSTLSEGAVATFSAVIDNIGTAPVGAYTGGFETAYEYIEMTRTGGGVTVANPGVEIASSLPVTDFDSFTLGAAGQSFMIEFCADTTNVIPEVSNSLVNGDNCLIETFTVVSPPPPPSVNLEVCRWDGMTTSDCTSDTLLIVDAEPIRLEWSSTDAANCNNSGWTPESVPLPPSGTESDESDLNPPHSINPPGPDPKEYIISCDGGITDSVWVANSTAPTGPPSISTPGKPPIVRKGTEVCPVWELNGNDPDACVFTGTNATIFNAALYNGDLEECFTAQHISVDTLTCAGVGADDFFLQVTPNIDNN